MPKILIIEDSMFQRRNLHKILETDNYDILEAASGSEGLDMIAAHAPDCVLLDIAMPGMTGFDVLRILQQGNGHRPPVIVITADIQSEVEQECLDLGATAFFHKPMPSEKDKLRGIVKDVLAM